ncbi:MAG TPA: right-handed parallel beta-helix repeat-containing protein [Candidatus Babeliales bacterium]|nr:right-handed parallel beta-helix repeat-containing protein [Candidatus Babeliales bacterium]
MNYKSLALFVLSIFFIVSVQAVELTVSQPGIYKLGDFIVSNPTGADSIINITSSNVILDLGGYVISQGNATASVDGIVINSSLTDVTVQNGTIRNVTGRGIVVNQNCSRIQVNGIVFRSCAQSGATFIGAVGNTINDCFITGCRFYNCPTAAGSTALSLTSCLRFEVSDCVVAGSTISGGSAAVFFVQLINCTQCTVRDTVVQGNSFAPAVSVNYVMFQDNAGTNNSFINCIARSNNLINGILTVFSLGGNLATVDRCQIIGNTNTGATTNCLSLSNATRTTMSQPIIMRNTGATVQGVFFTGGSASNILTDAVVSANQGTGLTIGISFNNGSTNTVRRCISSNNVSTGGICAGIAFVTAASNNCAVTDCLFSNNKGSSNANSFGANITVGANNLFTRNVGFNNNVAAAGSAQLVGVPAGSVTTPTAPSTQNINGVGTVPPGTSCLYWTNLSVAT